MPRTVLVAIGGNSLLRPGEPGGLVTERSRVAETCRSLAHLVSGDWRVLITHGNGPQVGAALRRSETAAADAYPLSLDLCVASTQGEIGLLLQQALGSALETRGARRQVATVLAQVVVAPTDPAFAHPNKPIGRFYSREEAEAKRRIGWTLHEEPPQGYRRVVPSPEPLEIVEEPAIRALVEAGLAVITLGGGGVPVVRRGHRLEGVEAVVDKDAASALLATRLGVDLLVVVTDVDGIYVDFGKPSARLLRTVDASRLHELASDGQFPDGSMGPKVQALLRFVAATGHEAVVTSPDRLVAAVDGGAGTLVRGVPGKRGEKASSWNASAR
jgi:carbamate kinase